jgi:hypothetical protein
MQVRGAIRGDRVRGERVIGWASGRLAPEKSAELFMMGVMHIPGVGPLFAAAMMAKQARFFVLTDRRFLILPVEKASLIRAKRGVSIPLGEVALSGWGKSILNGSMVVRAIHGEKSYALQIRPRKKSRPWCRLIEGLRMLSAEEESPPSRLS